MNVHKFQQIFYEEVEFCTLSSQITSHYKADYVQMSAGERASIKGYILNALTYCGLDREDAEERVADWDFEAKHGFAYSERKEAYLNGEITAAQVRSAMIEKGYSKEDANLWIEAYDWEKQGYEGVTAAAVGKYNEYCAALNISKDVYLHIREFSNNTENDVDANGKSINYSAMKKVMAEINAQNISAEQKTAIAKSLGWSDKNINKYKPW